MASTGLECQAHPGEHYTNFCTSPVCMYPLCPECIDDHVKMHKIEKSVAEVSSIQSVKQGCYRKLRTAIQILDEELNKPSSLYVSNYKQYINLQHYQIEKYKQKIIDQVTFHCNRLLEQLNSQNQALSQNAVVVIQTIQSVREQLLTFEQSLNIFNDYRKIDPLSKSREQRETEDTALEIVRKILQLDVKSLLDQLQANMKKETKNILNIYYDESQQDNFNQLLSKMILLSEQFNEDFIHHNQTELQQQYRNNEQQQQPIQQLQTRRMPSPINRHESQQSFISQSSFHEQAIEFEKQYQLKQQKPFPYSQQSQSHNYTPPPEIRTPQQEIRHNRFPPIQIQMPAFFHNKAQKKYLHFFKSNDRLLYLYDLNSMGNSFQVIQLKINFMIPSFHRSIITSHGDIYLLGGSDQKKLTEIYSYEPVSRTLFPSGNLIVPRSSFGVCYLHPYIYSASGFSQQSSLTATCEKYHIINAKSEKIADCLYIANAATLVNMNQEFIYKFGANNDDGSHQHCIERYIISQNRWEDVSFRAEAGFSGFLQFGSGCQINKNQMIIFGGYDFQNTGYDFTYLLEQDESGLIVSETFRLPQKEGFWNNQTICWHLSKDNQSIVALQNIQLVGTDDVNEAKRSVIMLSKTGWKFILH